MKIGLISTHLPPAPCAVGHATVRLAQALYQQGHQVTVWSSEKTPEKFEAFEACHTPIPIQLSSLFRLADEIKEAGIESLLIQFTPNLHFPVSGIPNVPLELLTFQLKRKLKIPITLNAHEVNYPVEFSKRGLLLGIPQVFHFIQLSHTVTRIIFTYEATCHSWKKYLPWRAKDFSWLPIGSNVPPQSIDECQDLITRLKDTNQLEGKKILLHFGSTHPTHLYAHMFQALESCLKKFGEDSTSLLFVGINQEKVDQQIELHKVSHLKKNTQGLGFIPFEEVSAWLYIADLILAPFMDGISTRRGSFMAALAHGRPIATTSDWATTRQIDWGSFCLIEPSTQKESYAQKVTQFLSLPLKERNQVGTRGRKFYENNFDWPIIAKKFHKS